MPNFKTSEATIPVRGNTDYRYGQAIFAAPLFSRHQKAPYTLQNANLSPSPSPFARYDIIQTFTDPRESPNTEAKCQTKPPRANKVMSLCTSDKPRKRPSKTVAVLLSCCLCLLVICACLVTALVFVGRHILYNHPSFRYVTKNTQLAPVDRLLVPQPSYQRLPRDTRPLVYDLTLLPDLGAGSFEGWVNATIEVTGFRKDLIIHSKNLTINEIKLLRSDSKELRVISVNELQEDEVLIITTREKIFPDVYYLFIGFEGSLKDRLTGFYRSEYRRSGEAR